MGFDAIWISPIIKNRDGGYHGYWGTNLYDLN
jgi:alpha-amylase